MKSKFQIELRNTFWGGGVWSSIMVNFRGCLKLPKTCVTQYLYGPKVKLFITPPIRSFIRGNLIVNHLKDLITVSQT